MDTDMDTHSAGLTWTGDTDNASVVPPSAPAMDGHGATTGTGQGSGEEHITFGKSNRKFDEKDVPEDKEHVEDAFSEFSEADPKDESDGVSLL
jgi:hypothetical protein